ncbi:hypothetical protein [Falsiroseomonas sp. HW251]|uniref:hypothetical protein n=1 Tax=Falsiroseomonas sp. HW251 TaxID=3390998 RepID=UPI003D31FEE5
MLLAAIGGAALNLLPLLHDRAAFFRDDMEIYFMPTLVAIGRSIGRGELPFLALQSWVGGNLAAEYQFGLFNPVLLAAYATLPAFGAQDGAAAFLAVAFGALLSAGAFVLARCLGLRVALAHAAAGAVAGNAFLQHWYAASWFPGFSSTAFLVWAMAAILRADRGGMPFVGAVAAVFLVMTAGWPFAVLTLGCFVAVWAAVSWWAAGWRSAVAPGVAGLLGLMAGGIAILPLVGIVDVASRPAVGTGADELMPQLRDVLLLSNLFHVGSLRFPSGENQLVAAPIFHAAWFVVPVLVLLRWERIRLSEPRLLLLLCFSGAMLLGTQAAGTVGWFRFPIRFLPGLHIAVVLLALVQLQETGLGVPGLGRILTLGTAIAVSAIVAMMAVPAIAVLPAACGLLLFYVALRLAQLGPGGATSAAMLVAGATWALAAMLRLSVPSALAPDLGVFARFGLPTTMSAAPTFGAIPPEYEFHAADAADIRLAPRITQALLFGQSGLAQGRAAINGYSPIGHDGLFRLLCWSDSRWPCRDSAARLFMLEPVTGSTLAQLMRVTRIVAAQGPHAEAVRAALPPDWRITEEGPLRLVVATARSDGLLPGSLAWHDPGIRVETNGNAVAGRETLRVSAEGSAPRMLVFARTYWPGYAASLNGAPLPVRAHAGTFVAVDMPAGAAGDLVLVFTPRGLREGTVMMLVAVVAACAVAGPMRRLRRT